MVKLNNYREGSTWSKWDLHIHSPLSFLNNQFPQLSSGKPDWERFINKLESLENIKVIGITDYFSIEGYKKLYEFKKEGRLKNIEAIFPNIEFRLNTIVSERRLNFHVLLSDELEPDLIDEQFLNSINFNYEGNPQEGSEARVINETNIRELGERLKKEHEEFSERNALELGASNAVVSYTDISEKLSKDSRFKGKYILVLPEELMSLMDWDGQNHHIRKSLLQQSDMVFSSNPKTRQWCLGQNPYENGKEKFIEEFKTLKPCIHGSDAHNIESIGNHCALRGESGHDCEQNREKCEQRYSWVKADSTFEGLKQLLYEPDERVKIQQYNPEPLRGDFSFKGVHVSGVEVNKTLSLSDVDLLLNKGLVAITGSKGAGKTALVDLISNCYEDRVHCDDDNSFVKRIHEQVPSLKTTIFFTGEEMFTKTLTEDSFVEKGQISYIAQSELEKYIGDNSDLSAYINNLIFDSPLVRNSALKHQYLTLNNDLNTIEDDLETLSAKIKSLEEQTSEQVYKKAKVEEKRIQAEIKDIQKKINDAEKKSSEENIKIAQKQQEKLANLKVEKDSLVSLKSELKEIVRFLRDELPRTNVSISKINELIKKLELGDPLPEIEYNVGHEEFDKRIETINKRLDEKVEEIDKIQKEVHSLQESIQSHTKLLDQKSDLEKKLENNKKDIEEIERNRTLLKENKKERLKLFEQMLNYVLEQQKKYEEIISLFSSEKGSVLSDLNFEAEINFDSERFINSANSVFDNRSVSNSEEEFRELIDSYGALSLGDKGKVSTIVKESEDIAKQYKDRLKKSVAIDVSNFYKFIYSNYLSVRPVVKYKDTEVYKLSLGQKATVLIKIYLAQGDHPIIIDSHDDHLDNEFIMGELVDAIREAKLFRQIILVSNNGNVVINSDAEQIVIAERNETEISYISGAIENPVVRDRALQVLEGGESAFRQRQNKYRINDIKK